MNIFSMPLSVHLIVVKDRKILLMKRKNTGFADGQYCTPAGKLEQGENAIQAMVREAKEELNISIEELETVQVMNRLGNDRERIDYFFIAKKWNGAIVNNEPEKCEELIWADIDQLPNNTIPYIGYALDCYNKNEKFTYYGW